MKAQVYFEGENQEITSRIELVSDIAPKLMKFTIKNTYPHDITSFTEGLEFFRDSEYFNIDDPYVKLISFLIIIR